jgi:peptide deformylase
MSYEKTMTNERTIEGGLEMKEKEKKVAIVGNQEDVSRVVSDMAKEAELLVPPGRKLVTVPNPLLREVSKPVEVIDSYVMGVVKDLQDWLGRPVQIGHYTSMCIGMSAPQLGELIRVYVVRLQGIDWVVINPEPVKARGKQIVAETCESIPNKVYKVKRAETFKVRALDLDGNQRGYKGHGLLAAVLQHELDHLDGIMIDEKGVYHGKVGTE